MSEREGGVRQGHVFVGGMGTNLDFEKIETN